MLTGKRGNIVSLGRVLASNVLLSKLFTYALDGKARKIEQLFASEVSTSLAVDMCNSRGQTALFVCCMNGHLKCAAVLLSLGANPNRRSDDGSTPTHAAAFSCSPTVLQLLVQKGGDLRLHDDRDMMPRDWAVEAGQKKNKKILEMMDQWQGQVVKEISSTSNSIYSISKKSTSSLTRLLRIASETQGSVTPHSTPRNSHLSQYGFGSFSSLKAATNQHHEIGFTAVIPILSPTSLNCATNEPTITYQSPPHYIVSNGRWGNQVVSIKRIKKLKRKVARQLASTSDLFITDIKINSLLRHPSILMLMGVCVEEGNESDPRSKNQTLPQCLVYERVTLGSLYFVLHEQSCDVMLTESIHLMIQVGQGLSYLHQRGLVHSCLSSHCIYLVDSRTAKISDFYYTTHSGDSTVPNRISHIYNRWLAPELLAEKNPSVECDVYSYCVVIVELLSGELPWKGFDPDSVRHQIVNKARSLPIPDRIPHLLTGTLAQGLVVSRRKRNITLQQISYSLQALAQSDMILHLEEKHDERGMFRTVSRTLDGTNMSSIEKPAGDVGVDVPDTVPFLPYSEQRKQKPSNINSSPVITNVTCLDSMRRIQHKKPFNSTVVSAHTMGREPKQNQNMTRNSFKRQESSRSKIQPVVANVTNATNYSPSKLSTLENSSGVESLMQNKRTKNFLDEEAGYIHPELLDTDSVNSSLLGYYDCKSNQDIGNFVANTKVTDYVIKRQPSLTESEENILTEAELQLLLGKNKNHRKYSNVVQANSVRTYTVDNTGVNRTSPYPDLSECKSSPGEYLLSGMSTEQGINKLGEGREPSLTSLPSSYGGYIPIPTAAANVPSIQCTVTEVPCNERLYTQDSTNCARTNLPPRPNKQRKSYEEMKGLPTHTTHSTHTVHRYSKQRQGKSSTDHQDNAMEQKVLVNTRETVLPVVSSPVHDSVERAHNSLLELSHIIRPHEGVVVAGRVKSKSSIWKDENLASDDGEMIQVGAGTFFEEVITAAGFSDPPGAERRGNGCRDEDGGVPASSVQCEEQKVEVKVSEVPIPRPRQDGVTYRRKIKKKKTRKQNFAPVEEKYRCTDVSRKRQIKGSSQSEESEPTCQSVEVLYSNFPSNITVTDSYVGSEYDTGLNKASSDGCLLVHNRNEEIQSVQVPYPSALSSDKASHNTLEGLYSQFANCHTAVEEKKQGKRFSITSDDLEDIFADFADRKRFYKSEENEEETEIAPEEVGVDVLDGRVVEPIIVPKLQSLLDEKKTLFVSRSVQTLDGMLGDRKKKEERRISALSPPSISDFMKRTGNWKTVFTAVETQTEETEKNNITDPSSPDLYEDQNSTNPYSSHFETCLELPDLTKEIGNHYNGDDASVQSINLTTVTRATSVEEKFPERKFGRAVIPASRMQPIESTIHDRQQLLGVLSPRYSRKSFPNPTELFRSQSARESQSNEINFRSAFVVGEQSAPSTPIRVKTDENGMNVTPSRWSFHHKLSLFEDNEGKNERKFPQFKAVVKKRVKKSKLERYIQDEMGGSENDPDAGNDESEQVGHVVNKSSEDRKLESQMFTTAEENGVNSLNKTPANPSVLVRIRNEKGVKTSTPVVQKGLVLNQVGKKVGNGLESLDESYAPKIGQNLENLDENLSPQDQSIACKDSNADKAGQSSFNNSSLLQMSGIPRCQGLPDVSTESNATFAEVKSECNITTAVTEHYQTADNQEINQNLLDSKCSNSSSALSSSSGENELDDHACSELRRGISELSTALASDVLRSQMNDEIIKTPSFCSSGSCEMSGISYDEDDSVSKEKKRPLFLAVKTADSAPPNMLSRSVDTSVWMESQGSVCVKPPGVSREDTSSASDDSGSSCSVETSASENPVNGIQDIPDDFSSEAK
ncbi:uncharacterized protein LOC108950590 [Ciona intestinalis]